MMGMCKHCGKTTYLTHLHSCEIKPKEWQGLTNDEVLEIYKNQIGKSHQEGAVDYYLEIEQKLKEKNHG